MSQYSLLQSKKILKSAYKLYKKKGQILTDPQRVAFEKDLYDLDQAILDQDKDRSNLLAKKTEEFTQLHFHKTFFDYTKELIIAIVLALAVATIIRQGWFELYEIPTGSMRPTFFEQDHLTVTKLSFGINMPLKTEHIYFDPKLVQRASILIFSGDKIPVLDSDTNFLWVLPYKKRYIKRLIGKPGDHLYFYGGKIYGIDKDDQPIKVLLDDPSMQHIEHIPFITFEGTLETTTNDRILFKQMQEARGRLSMSPQGMMIGQVYNGKEWVKDQPDAQKTPHKQIETFSDFLGIRNFAMARLLTKEQLSKLYGNETNLEDAELYLELRHTPSLTYPHPRIERMGLGVGVFLTPQTTFIPLQQHHLDAIMDNMYTARFVIEDGRAHRYSVENNTHGNSIKFPSVPNGTYEFYFGKAVQVGWGGIISDVPKDSLLYSHSKENVQRLFNQGIDLNSVFDPGNQQQFHFPQRYAYFKDGDLYLLGAPVLKKSDPALISFVEKEKTKEQNSTSTRPYIAFKDYGPPLLQDGSFDKEFIKTFGVKVPEQHYLVLGDNHAMSSDSRVFGFIPQNNLQGAPSLIIWPPGDRIGFPKQRPYPILNTPRAIIWGIALLILLGWYLYHRWFMKQRIMPNHKTKTQNNSV